MDFYSFPHSLSASVYLSTPIILEQFELKVSDLRPLKISNKEALMCNVPTSRFKRECPRGPREITKMWHMLEKLISLIFCRDSPWWVNKGGIFALFRFAFVFQKICKNCTGCRTAKKSWTLEPRVSTQELRSWKVQKQVCFSSFCTFPLITTLISSDLALYHIGKTCLEKMLQN